MCWLRQIKGDYLWLLDIVCVGASFEAIQHSRPLQSIRSEWSKGQGLLDDLSTWSSRNLRSLWVARVCFDWCTRRSWEELAFMVGQAKQNILAWKAHLLRCVNQDEAPLEVTNALDESSVLLVQDWAMKLLPRKFRESQSDWFAREACPGTIL